MTRRPTPPAPAALPAVQAGEPVPVAAHLEEVRRRLQAAQRPPTGKEQAAGPISEAWEYDDGPTHDEWLAERLRMRWTQMCPSRFLWAQTSDFDPVLAEDLDAWAAEPAGRNLLLFGPVGSGKTHGAIAACRPLVDHGQEMMFLPVDELLDLVWSRSERDSMEDLVTADLLVIDDLGSEKKSDFATSRLYSIINRRWMEERPTVATTNADPADDSPDGLRELIGERIFSRLVGGAIILRVSGEDRRRKRDD